MSQPEISKPTEVSSVPIKKRHGRLFLHGFGKMVAWLIVLIVILTLLSTTSFLSDFILKNLNKIDIKVNPIAAASHQTSVATSDNASASDVNETKDQVQSKTPQVTSTKQSANLANSKEQSADKKPQSKADLAKELSHARTLDEKRKIQQLADESILEKGSDHPDAKVDLINLPPQPVLDGSKSTAQAIVVLGGGLTRDDQGNIIPNIFSQLRLLQAISQHRATELPIFLSGVEAPYMQAWLKNKGVTAQWLEARSMNTCENARFSALMLQKLGGAPRVELVTDEWHVPRARWLFAMNGIETVAVPAPLPGDPTPWWPDARNLTHTRRALHELVAFTRDRWFGVVGCREVP
ncbi:YdcF family protein [Aquirhabdus sp.]|uniref:YdcF family protein n=1 Tax=Aquirhabdus sp. TaxID=2824160 RepID=UPI00396CA764